MTITKKYFGTWDFYKRAILIAVPVMLQQLIQNLVSLIDNFMVAGLGDIKMSGVNIAGQILFVFMVFINTICTAGGIFMTQFSGAADKKGMQQSLCFKFLIAGIAFIFYILVCEVFPRPILALLVVGNSEADAIVDVGVEYIKLMGLVGIQSTVSTILATSLREIGEVKIPLIVSVIATLTNTFFNWVLIYGNLGAPRLEVRGAAYATIIAHTIEVIIFIVYLNKRKPPFMIGLSDLFHIDVKLIKTILKKGYLVLFSEMLWVISETITTALYNGRGGADVVSGMASSFAIANLFFVSFGGITTATSVILGKTLGEGKLDEARKRKDWMMGAAVVFGIFMAFVGFLTTYLVPVVFGSLSLAAQEICRRMVLLMSILMPLWVFINTQFAVSRSGGDTKMGAYVDGGFTLILIIPGIFIIARYTNLDPVMMYLMVKLVDIPKIIFAAYWLRKEKWIRNLTVSK